MIYLQVITLVDRVGQMEETMRRMQEVVDKSLAVNMSLNDRVSDIELGTMGNQN